MTDKEFEFFLSDRVQKIQQIDNEFNLQKNAYIAFSGGKDSTVLSALVDVALPENKIPRVYTNTGIEYKEIVKYVHLRMSQDNRFIEIAPHKNIREILLEDGFPFKSKEHSKKYRLWHKGSFSQSVMRYWATDETRDCRYSVPKTLAYQKEKPLSFPISEFCCERLKKEPARKWSKENGKRIALLGIRNAEGGQRSNIKSCLYYERGELKHFMPLLPMKNDFIEMFIKRFNVQLAALYYPPYNFRRTGCKGCPFATDLQSNLDTLQKFFPAERKQCEFIFKEVYNEYRRLNYRLKGK